MVSYTEGDIAFMHCRARGVPNPSVEWMVDGEAVQSVDLRYEVLNEGTLKIINVTRSDAGIYECIATNEGGQMHANTTLQVKCEISSLWNVIYISLKHMYSIQISRSSLSHLMTQQF